VIFGWPAEEDFHAVDLVQLNEHKRSALPATKGLHPEDLRTLWAAAGSGFAGSILHPSGVLSNRKRRTGDVVSSENLVKIWERWSRGEQRLLERKNRLETMILFVWAVLCFLIIVTYK
jgi:hypothetical protein